jgi:hypothetical protein
VREECSESFDQRGLDSNQGYPVGALRGIANSGASFNLGGESNYEEVAAGAKKKQKCGAERFLQAT